VAPTTPTGDKTKSTFWGNPEPAVDPCELAISTGATWVGRGFSGDVKQTTQLIVDAIKHRGFAFLNVMSPCVTWRGDAQFKALKEIQAYVPDDHDRTQRAEAIKYTRETGVMTTGVLYEVEAPSFDDRLESLRRQATAGRSEPTTREILERFFPKF
ncbi:MAG TPA: thiamine pyrophosphate-dependent enzyme, partial [Thermoanaerobaculales bacterium]|nr:thiamine pyrophosphate-dependent enzyme [Thermoanaerobaculales bacterium]